MATSASSEERELSLVLKLELRLGSADTDAKFESLLQTYLAPLILKLASEHVSVRNKVIGVCQYLNRRLKASTAVHLPISTLLKQFREANNGFIKHFDLLYIQQGLERVSVADGTNLLPEVLKTGIPSRPFKPDSSEGKTWSVTFQFLLKLLRNWKLPDRLSQEAIGLKDQLSLSHAETDVLAYWLARFLLYDGQSSSQASAIPADMGNTLLGTNHSNVSSMQEQSFFSAFDASQQTRISAAELQSTKANLAKLLFMSVFSDPQRFIPAVILTSDASNLECFRTGDTMFKQCTFDLEDVQSVRNLYQLYDGKKIRIQIRVLALLARSKEATKRTINLASIIDSVLAQSAEGLEASKLRASVFSLVDWVIRMGDIHDISTVGPVILTVMKSSIENQGWPAPRVHGERLSFAELELREQAYSCIGQLTTKLSTSYETLKFLFTSLRCDNTNSKVHDAVNAALGQAINHFKPNGNDDLTALKNLLLLNMTATVGTEDITDDHVTAFDTRFTTVKCANRSLPFADEDARFIDLLGMAIESSAAAKDGLQVAEEGARGLDPYLHRSNQFMASDSTTQAPFRLPDYQALVNKVFRSHQQDSAAGGLPEGSAVVRAISFCIVILVLSALESTKKKPEISPDWERQVDALVSNDQEARRAITQFMTKGPFDATITLLSSAAAGLSRGHEELSTAAWKIFSLLPTVLAEEMLKTPALISCKQGCEANNAIVQLSAARSYGVLASLNDNTKFEKDISSFVERCRLWPEAVGQDAVKIRGYLLASTYGLTRRYLRGINQADADLTQHLVNLASEIMKESRDVTLRTACSLAFSQICLCLPEEIGIVLNVEEILAALVEEAKNEQEAAIAAIGRLIRFASGQSKDQFVFAALEKLYSLHEIRKAEVHFAVGESLAVAVAGWHSTSLISELDVDAPMPATPVNHVLVSSVLTRCIDDCRTTKPSLKKAAAIWLLCLIQYCGKQSPIVSKLRQCQAAFGRLLTDRDEIVQETGSKGLALVYEMGDTSIREDLVRDLVQSFTGSDAKLSGSVNEDTELFETGALPIESGASVTTYKDIVSLANEVGDPSLVYRFMNLATHNAIWTSRAAFGRFGLSSILANSDYLSQNKKFYPKLFRYRFDPNPNVQRSMNDIWKALVKNQNVVIDENFDLIIEDLLKSILGKEWRVREASCGAIAELVQDRDVEKYEDYLAKIWEVAFKVVDDIKETVRVAAMKLCKTLVGLLIRNLEVGDGMTKRAGTMLHHALDFLSQQFTSGSAKEVQAYAIGSLLEIVRKCPPKALKPFVPVLLENLIISLSSLEHESINYLHLNADKYGLTPDKLDSMRVSGVNSSPVMECIGRCLESLDTGAVADDDFVREAMKRLENAFKESIGLPSKVGLSRVIVTLVVRHPVLFKPFVDRFVQLNRRSILDRNPTISVSFATSLAYQMRLASDKQVHETAKFAKDLYFDSEHNSQRALAGEVVQAIAKVSNDVFMRFSTLFLPFAFIGRNDMDTEVHRICESTWKDTAGGSRSVALYLTDIVELARAHIKSAKWAIKHACGLATADLIQSADPREQYTVVQAQTIWPLLMEALAGKTWDGKEKIISAYPHFVRKSRCLWTDNQKESEMPAVALREARRTNVTYRPHAILAMGEFARVRDDLDLSADVLPILRKVVEGVTVSAADRMDIDTGNVGDQHLSKDLIEKTLVASSKCLFQVVSAKSTSEVLESSIWIVDQVRSSAVRPIRLALYQSVKEFVERTPAMDERARRECEDIDGGKDFSGNETEKGVEVFTTKVTLALLEDAHDGGTTSMDSYADDPETLRRARVTLGLAVIAGGVARALPHGRLESIVKKWLTVERSRPLRDDIQKVILDLEAKE